MNICARKISLPKILDTKSYWMGCMRAKGGIRTDSSMAFLYKTFDKWAFELRFFLLHMSYETKEANFCAFNRPGLVRVDFSSIGF